MPESSSPYSSDTIAAIATPTGVGGIGIVRLSGAEVPKIAVRLLGLLPSPRVATYRLLRDAAGEPIDDGIALYFPAPHSFTGEAVLELQGHGGPVVLDLVLRATLAAGARLARPGEFSERAFLNDKLDLAQAEAVADLIESHSEQAARAALRSLQGAFSDRIESLGDALTHLRVFVEAALDFPEEEIDFLADERIGRQLIDLIDGVVAIQAQAQQGRLLRDGMSVVLAGRPNAGKSSLMNRLAGRDTAIVTAIPGTTRDVLREQISLDGLPLHLIDTAGLRDSDDPVEQEGVRRAWREIEHADRLLLLLDDSDPAAGPEQALMQRLPASLPITRIYNKIDLSGRAAALWESEGSSAVALSALTGDGVELLVRHLQASVGFDSSAGGAFSARRRHLEALSLAEQHLREAREQLERHAAGEIVAEELRSAHHALGEISGKMSSDELLGRIFSSFCIGK